MGAGVGIFIVGHIPESNIVYYGTEKYIRAFLGVAIGLLIVVGGWRIKVTDDDKAVACPKCGTSYLQQDVTKMECPACRVELEDLEGFYKRHPEWIDKSNLDELKKKIGAEK